MKGICFHVLILCVVHDLIKLLDAYEATARDMNIITLSRSLLVSCGDFFLSLYDVPWRT